MYAGTYDKWLVITTGVKPLAEYNVKTRKDGTLSKLPPHARAAKMAMDMGYQNTYDISFIILKMT